MNYSYQIPEKLTDGWEVSSAANEGLNTDSIVALTEAILKDEYKNIHSVLIVRNNKLIHESYFNGYQRSTLHNLYSASKSFQSALVGIAIDKGLLKLDQHVLPFFPEYFPLENNDIRKDDITIQHLLTMSSGLECNDWDKSSVGNEENVYKKKDIIDFTLNLPQLYNPGDTATYCSAGVIVLANIITKVSGKNHTEFAHENLFAPMNITDYKWGYREKRKDRPDQVFLKPRDMAKFGQLYLNKGKWNGTSLISENWIEQSLARQANLQGIDYGFLWWRGRANIKNEIINIYSAQGNGGQFIFIIPALKLMVVTTGGNLNSPLTNQAYSILGKVLNSVEEQ